MLLYRIEVHLRRTGVSPTRFGKEVARDPRLVFDLRAGRTVGDRLARRVMSYIAERAA